MIDDCADQHTHVDVNSVRKKNKTEKITPPLTRERRERTTQTERHTNNQSRTSVKKEVYITIVVLIFAAGTHCVTQDILKAKSNITLFIFENIYTRSDFKQMEHCH